MNIHFLEPARAELADAVNYYNFRAEGLGFDFSDEHRQDHRIP